jgi:hypothetical protein
VTDLLGRLRGGAKKGAAVAALSAAVIMSVGIAPALAASSDPATGTFTELSAAQLAADPFFAAARAGDGTAAGAVLWYQKNAGYTGLEGMCELAAEKSYGTSGIWPTAISHWHGAKHKLANPRHTVAGSFMFWNTSRDGHVGISDGKGGFYATSYGGRIGHGTNPDYYGKGKFLGASVAGRPNRGTGI